MIFLRVLFYFTLVVSSFSCPRDSEAVPLKGHDVLGLGNPNFTLNSVVNGISDGSAIGVFDSTWPDNFGDPYPKVKSLVESGKVSAVRIHIWWSYQHVGVAQSVLVKALPRWEQLAIDNPSVKIYISPSCEYRADTAGNYVVNWIKAIKQRAPHTIPVLAPMPGAPVVKNILLEHHTDKLPPVGKKILSTDGNSIFDANARKLVNQNGESVMILAWAMRYNLAQSPTPEKGYFSPVPRLRTADPGVQYIRSIDDLLYPPVENISDLRKPELWKTHAEDKVPPPGHNTDPRANKPVLIIKQKVGSVLIFDSNGTQIGSLGYFGTYPGNMYRYYSGWAGGSGHYAYEFGRIAKSNTGSPVIFAQTGTRRFKIGAGAFRVPFYQQ